MVVLVREDDRNRGPVPTFSLNQLPSLTARAHEAGITAVKVFATDRRDASGTRAAVHGSVMTRAIRAIKSERLGMQVMTETCLCGYLSSGDCHLATRHGRPDQAATIEAMAHQAVTQAEAGADVVGPAAMVPGSIAACRSALDSAGCNRVRIMPHLILHSRLYGGYRAAMGIRPQQRHRPFQLPASSRTATAVERGLSMLSEGADSLLIEPALFSTDILCALHARAGVPLLPFSVSGECTALPLPLLAEEYTMLLRAGASRVVSHAALTLAATLGDTPIAVPTS
jgi:porphobilinogen synthase